MLFRSAVLQEFIKLKGIADDLKVFETATGIIKQLPVEFEELQKIEDAWNKMIEKNSDDSYSTKRTKDGELKFSFNIDDIFTNCPHIKSAYKSFKFIFNFVSIDKFIQV